MDNTPFQPITVFLKSNEYSNLLGTSDYLFELNQPILSNQNVDILVNLSSFKFTNSLYTVTEYNNKLYWYYISDLTKFTITLTIGCYDIYSLVSEINKQFANALTSFVITYNPSNYTTTINNGIGSSFILWGGSNNCLKLIGFDNINGTGYTYKTSFTSPNCINLIPTQVIHIAIPNLALKSVGAKNIKRYNIIDTVHVTSARGETNLYINSSPFRYKINDTIITFLHIQLLDENYNLVNFNGVDWYIKLCFEFTYRNNLILPQKLVEHHDYMQPVIEQEEKRNFDRVLDAILNYRKKISK